MMCVVSSPIVTLNSESAHGTQQNKSYIISPFRSQSRSLGTKSIIAVHNYHFDVHAITITMKSSRIHAAILIALLTAFPPVAFATTGSLQCRGQWSADIGGNLAAQATTVAGCTYSGAKCDSYTFSYEMEDRDGNDDVLDIRIVDGTIYPCTEGEISDASTIVHYTDHHKNDMYSAKFYDFTVNPVKDSTSFCIYITCDNALFSCDNIFFRYKVSCNVASAAAPARSAAVLPTFLAALVAYL